MVSDGALKPAAGSDDHDGEHVRFVPGEVCLVVESNDAAAAASYDEVRTRVNQA